MWSIPFGTEKILGLFAWAFQGGLSFSTIPHLFSLQDKAIIPKYHIPFKHLKMYFKLLALFTLVASAVAITGDATFYDGTVAQGACADEHPVRKTEQT
jgi:hypothetical protein